MWRDVFLASIAALMVPLVIMVWKILRGVAIFQQFPPHLHVDRDTIRYPTGMEPGKVERLKDRGATAG
jgi:hypothetical protein